MYTFIVANLDIDPIRTFGFTVWQDENLYKEAKNGFNFNAVISHSKVVNLIQPNKTSHACAQLTQLVQTTGISYKHVKETGLYHCLKLSWLLLE